MEESIGDRDWEGIGRVSIEESLEPFKLETIQKADHYARYLAKVNDTSEVHTTQDIRNHHGV